MAKQVAAKQRFRRGIYLLPSLFTTGNLFFGYASVIATVQGDYRRAALFIGISFVLDGVDGRLARVTKSQTDFGSIYDSLADLVAFGIAPAVLVFSWSLWHFDRIGWLIGFLFVICAAARLARFTVQPSSAGRSFFSGLPAPAAAGLLAALTFFSPDRIVTLDAARALLAAVVVTAVLMISTVRYRSLKEVEFRRRQPYTLVALIGLAIVLIALDPPMVLLLLATGYVISGPVERLIVRLRHRGVRERPNPSPSRRV